MGEKEHIPRQESANYRRLASDRLVSLGPAQETAVDRARCRTVKGLGMNAEIGVWLGMAAVALIGANLGLWRARRALSQSRQDTLLQEITSLHDAVLMPSPVTESVSPALVS